MKNKQANGDVTTLHFLGAASKEDEAKFVAHIKAEKAKRQTRLKSKKSFLEKVFS